ncbi:DUF4255 domain-containing protein [Synechococcus sp. PCC 7336]|uniref:DUF4255 domain-containing protein n=1 Tax=Synechococcus sp. PCC 7336 TaxID=195250 RepID=UPI00034655E1|nr:DUF4255 domain-containing protein [Synechococcus sp. PCC 7336]
MSNHLAIATVTAVLQKKLQEAIQRDVDGARVTVSRPNAVENGVLEMGVNLYLYQAVPNAVWHTTAELRGRQRKGEMAKRSRTGLDLHYMLSFYGNDGEHEPQRLLGSALRTLSDLNTLRTEAIQAAITDSTFAYLADSDLAHQLEEISVYPLDLSLDDLSKIWSVFFQTPYALSMAYKATVIIIEGDDPAQRALPVRDRPSLAAVPYPSQPVVDEVVSQAGRFAPILADSRLSILGKQLQGPQTWVRIGDVEAVPTTVEPGKVVVSLASLERDRLQAGVQNLKLVHRPAQQSNGSGTAAPALVESNVMPFVLCPQIIDLQVETVMAHGDDLRDGELTLQVDLALDPQQKVVLALNEWSVEHPVAYLFEAKPRSGPTRSVEFALRDVKASAYLVRLQVDGAASPLQVDRDSSSPTYNWFMGPKFDI